METLAAFMLLLSCSKDLAQCREVPAPAIAYESIEDCNAELAPAIGRAGEVSRVAIGKCLEFDQSLLEADAEIVWDITPEGGLVAGLVPVTPDEETDAALAAMLEDQEPGDGMLLANLR